MPTHGPGTYLDLGGLATPPGPLDCYGATLWAFWVAADRAALEDLLRRAFDEPTEGAVRCRPLFGAVMVTFGVIDRIVPRTHGYDKIGHVTERQVALWVPTVMRSHAPAQPEGERFAAFLAAMWLDNPLSIATGREVYGYPKHWGWPLLPRPGEPECLALDALAWDYAPENQPERQVGFLVAEPVGEEAVGEERPGSLSQLATGMGRELLAEEPASAPEGLGWLSGIAAMVFRQKVPQLLLRQFRSPAGGRAADVQQVVLAPARARNVRWKKLGPYELSARRFDSHPLLHDLGLGDAEPAKLGFRVRMDFSVEVGDVVWPPSHH